MTALHQQVMDEISTIPTEKLGQIIDFIRFVKHQFNNETLAAIDEVKTMKQNPETFKTYSSFSEILAEVEGELANEV